MGGVRRTLSPLRGKSSGLELSSLVLKSDNLAVAKAITIVENNDAQAKVLLKRLYPHTGHSFIIGVTGPTGTGKSTLVDGMISEYRKRGKTVGVLAVDPTSPFTGGALLGDRIRMVKHNLDSAVFIRSMASRGDIGGLATAARDAVRILDASGKDIIVIETVGIGQTESEIIRVADVTVVVLMPQLGDEIQALKAGIMELGNIFVINKYDLEGADKAFYTLTSLITPRDGWRPPVIRTVAKSGRGINEVLEQLERFRKFRDGQPDRQKIYRDRLADELLSTVKHELLNTLAGRVRENSEFWKLIDRMASKKIDPHSASKILIHHLVRSLTR